MSNIVRGSSKKGKMVILHTEIYFENCSKRGPVQTEVKLRISEGRGWIKEDEKGKPGH